MTGKLICKVFGHRVDRKRVRLKDYDTFVGKCGRCNARMVRTPDGWVADADLD